MCGLWVVGVCVPNIVITALFSEAGTDIGTLFLNNGTFVGDGLGGSNVADELLDYMVVAWVSNATLSGRRAKGEGR